jgi:hypothetical protein
MKCGVWTSLTRSLSQAGEGLADKDNSIAECGVKTKIFFCSVIFSFMAMNFTSFAIAADKWQGVDEAVVEKIAKEHGREPREPFINTDQGDLLLFAFLIAGTVGGFAAGYFWRKLSEPKRKE